MAKFSPDYIPTLINQHRTRGLRLKRSDRDAAAEKLDAPLQIWDSFARRRQEIQTDERYSAAGKQDALVEAGREALRNIESWFNPISEGLAKHEAELLKEFREAVTRPRSTDPAERLESAFVRSEIRAQARGLGDIERELLYRGGDAVVRDALDEIPLIVTDKEQGFRVGPYVPDDVREEILLDVGRQRLPEKAELLDDIRSVREVYEIVANHTRKAISDEAPQAVEPKIEIVEPKIEIVG